MSLPTFPPGWFTPEPGDAIPPVEKERHWWTPIAAATDRWLQPRWRALLTWTLLATLTAWTFHLPEIQDGMRDGVRAVFTRAGEYLSFAVPLSLQRFGEIAAYAFLSSWYPPIMLQLGFVRWLVWMLASVLVACSQFFGPTVYALENSYPAAARVLEAVLFGLPGLAVYGRRGRPWMSFLGVGATILAVTFLTQNEWFYWQLGMLWGLIPGAVMLYGTSPLPRKEGAR